MEDFSSATLWLQEARTLYAELRDQLGEADVLTSLGTLAHWQREYQQACVYFERAIATYENIGISYWDFWPRVRMGHTVLQQGDFSRAYDIFKFCIQQYQMDDILLTGVVYAIEGLAGLHLIQRQPEHATRLFAWADASRQKIGNRRPPIEQKQVDQEIIACLTQMGEEAFSDAYEMGKKLSLEEAIACATEAD